MGYDKEEKTQDKLLPIIIVLKLGDNPCNIRHIGEKCKMIQLM